MAPLVRTGGSRHTGLAAPPHRNIHITDEEELAKLSIIKYFYTEKEFVTVLNRLGVDITQRHGATSYFVSTVL